MVKKGDWVVNGRCEGKPTFGIVREIYTDYIGEVVPIDPTKIVGAQFVDIICYSSQGDKIGRVSKAFGGPTIYEPSIPIEQLQVIEEPNFPLKLNMYGEYGNLFIPIP